jgi:hypothetical protein
MESGAGMVVLDPNSSAMRGDDVGDDRQARVAGVAGAPFRRSRDSKPPTYGLG